VPLAIPLIVLVGVLVALGMASTSSAVSKGIAGWMPSWLKKAAFFVIPLAQQTVALARYLSHALGIHYGAIVHHAVRWFSELAHYVDVVGYWSLYWPVELYNVASRIIYHEIPTAIKARTAGLVSAIAALKARVGALAHEVGSLPHTIKGLANTKILTRIERVALPHAAEWDWIHDHFDALRKAVAAAAVGAAGAIVLPHFPAFPIPWRGEIKALKKRLTKVEGLLGVTALAIAMSRVLGVSSRCLRSGNVGKMARALCGLPADIFAALLGGLVVLEGGFSVVAFTQALQSVEDEIVQGLTATISELQGL
jgi:hypothetical protein